MEVPAFDFRLRTYYPETNFFLLFLNETIDIKNLKHIKYAKLINKNITYEKNERNANFLK